MWLCLCAFPWDRPKRSYKNTSTYGTGLVFRRCRFRSRVRLAMARCSSGVLVLTTASACLLGLCGLVLWLNHRYEFDSYMTVSVVIQNMGGVFSHPMGRVSGITTSPSLLFAEGEVRPVF